MKPEKRQYRSQGPEVARFFEAFCKLGEGDSYGDPFVPRPWQRKLLNKMFELVWDQDRRRWRRRYRRALVGLPTGSGKTPLAAGVGLWFLCSGQHRSPLVACSAASKEQSGLVFGNARVSAEADPLAKFLETGRDQITVKGGPGRLYRVSAADGTNDGQVISCLIKDEYHEWSETKNTDAILTKATAKVVDPFQLHITTAGFDLDTLCGKLYQHGKAVQRGEEEDDKFFFHWVEADEDMDPDDEATWAKVHPAAGDFMSLDAIRDKHNELTRPQFRRYYLNNWIATDNTWFEPGVWDACEVVSSDAEFEDGAPVWVGWDGSQRIDSTAIVAIQRGDIPERDEDGDAAFDGDEPIVRARVKVLSRIWDRPRLANGKPDPDWTVPQIDVEDYIRELAGRFDVHAVPFDPRIVLASAQRLAGEGIEMAEFPQSSVRMAEATQALFSLVKDRTIAFAGGDEEAEKLSRHIANAVYEPLRDGGGRLVKGRAKKPMDGAVALAMAVWMMLKEQEREKGEKEFALHVFVDDDDDEENDE